MKIIDAFNKISDKWVAYSLLLIVLAFYAFMLMRGVQTTFIEGMISILVGLVCGLLKRSTTPETPTAGTITGDISVNTNSPEAIDDKEKENS